MKIGVKITLLAASAITALIVCVVIGHNGTNSVSSMFTYAGDVPIKNTFAASDIIDQLTKVTQYNALYYHYRRNPEKLKEITQKIADAGAIVSKQTEFLEGNVAPERKKVLEEFRRRLAISGAARKRLSDYVEAGDWESYLSYRVGEYQEQVDASLETMHEFAQLTREAALVYCYETSDEHADEAQLQLTIVAVVSVVLLVVVSFIIITGITKPLKRAVTAANAVAEGNLKVDLSTNSTDETGLLMNSLETMVESINKLIADTNTLSSAGISGQLEVRADISRHQGAYRELVHGINQTLDAVIGPLNVTAEYVDRISKGDMPPRITDAYNGDFNEIKNNLNGCMDAITLLVREINQSITKALEGDFKYRADAGKFKGDFKKIMEGVNALVDAFVEPLQLTSEFLQGVALGSEGIQKINKDFKGEFNVIKDAVNHVHDVLFAVLGGIVSTAEEAEKGNLDKRVDTSKVKGAWIMIMGGLNKITGAANAIITDAGAVLSTMATGDLTPRINKDYLGKFGEMKKDINNLGDSLTDLISRLTEAIHTTAAASAQISSTADTLSAGLQEQSSQTDEVASSMEEMSRTVTDNAHSASKTAEVAKSSGDTANNGGKVVQQTVTKMREISSVVQSSAQNIAKLGESSKKIGEIISVIDDIADQTNLLSLNAAIEAARAGEQGRGFAVVADSVGKLAISTASATKEIAEMIKGIQRETEGAVTAMEKGTAEVQSGIELADQAGNSIQSILSGINNLLDMINQIAAASEEQSATSEEISKNISSISKVAADSARNVEDVAATANELAKMTETLTSLVSQFKVDPRYHHNSSSADHSDKYLS